MTKELDLARYVEYTNIMGAMVDRFLSWPLPVDVRADDCACKPSTGRTGTNLLTADQARQMLEHVLADAPLLLAEVRRLRTLERDLSECRAALAERQAAIDELCLLSELLVMGDPQVAKRKAAGWVAIRALATKEPQS